MRRQPNLAITSYLDRSSEPSCRGGYFSPCAFLATLFVRAGIFSSNDEVERRGVALTSNEADLSRTSTRSLGLPKMLPRDRSNRWLGFRRESDVGENSTNAGSRQYPMYTSKHKKKRSTNEQRANWGTASS